jgi:diaminopimelate epimerase
MTRRSSVSFEKWEGLGNDFAVVEAGALDPTPDLVRRLCDRRFGIGADGVLLVDRARPRMTVYNADGSRPEMCGNGLRCVAAYLATVDARYETNATDATSEFTIATDAGDRKCLIHVDREGRFEVSVAMGVAQRSRDLVVHLDGREHRFASIDIGNPHAITFERYEEAEIDAIGPRVATTPEGGVNVEFCCLGEAREANTRIEVTVWERGVGRTLACGTGACAVAAAACDAGLAAFGEPLRIALPGGELTITVAKESRATRMRGPARRVFTGTVEIA